MQHKIFNLLPVRRALIRGPFLLAQNTSRAERIKVLLAHRQRIKPEFSRNMIHHPFNPDNPLRPAKTSIRSGGLGVGAKAMTADFNIGQMIGIIGVQHGAITHRQA